MRSGSSETKLVQELILYAASAALSCLVLFVGLRHLDPNREASKKALENKKEIAKRLGRPLIQTNSYEVNIASVVFFISFREIIRLLSFCILVPKYRFVTIFMSCWSVFPEDLGRQLFQRRGIQNLHVILTNTWNHPMASLITWPMFCIHFCQYLWG